MRSLLLFTSSLPLLALITSGSAQVRLSYGESCNKTARCDSRAFLTCSNETCQCLKETEMMFDVTRTKCVVLAGERCMYTAMESDGNDMQERRWAEELDCVANANCDGYCSCDSEFHENLEGLCVPNKSYGESCEKDRDCLTSKNLICSSGKCLCNATDAIYESDQSMCVGKAGASCFKYSRCVRNAHRDQCRYYGVGNRHYHCQFREDSYENSEGLCISKKTHGESCERIEECRAGVNFICTGGKCVCNETEADYSYEKGMCVGKVGASCRKYPHCVPNAYIYCCTCHGAEDKTQLCQCRSNAKQTADGHCLGGYNAQCDAKKFPCRDEFSCVNGNCQCHFPDNQEYKDSKCRSHLNGPCLETVREKVFQYECPNQAECRNDNGHPECLCKKGYIRSNYGICKKAFGTSCNFTKDSQECDQVLGSYLICNEGTCSCKDFQVYDERLHKCLSLWGGKCTEYGHCTENAYCEIFRNDAGSGICRCGAGSKVDSNRKCVLGTGLTGDGVVKAGL